MKNIQLFRQNNLEFITERKTKTDISKRQFSNQRSDRRLRMKMMDRFMRPLRSFLIDLGKTPRETPVFNPVFRENMKHGFRKSCKSIRLDYTKLIVSKGGLPNPAAMSVCSPKPGKLKFRWTDNSGIPGAYTTDLLFIAVFNRESKSWIFIVDAAPRSTRHYCMEAGRFQEKCVQVYAGFVSADSERISTSLFLGEVRVW